MHRSGKQSYLQTEEANNQEHRGNHDGDGIVHISRKASRDAGLTQRFMSATEAVNRQGTPLGIDSIAGGEVIETKLAKSERHSRSYG